MVNKSIWIIGDNPHINAALAAVLKKSQSMKSGKEKCRVAGADDCLATALEADHLLILLKKYVP